MDIKRINKKVTEYNGIMNLLLSFISIATTLWIVFGYLHNQGDVMDKILQNTLKNTITNENLVMEERLNACDIYIEKGYNSATEKKCKKLYDEY